MKITTTLWCMIFLLYTTTTLAQNTLEAGPDILTGDGSGVQNWGDNVTLQAFKIDGSPGIVKLDSRRKDEGFGVQGARWGQIDYYQDYQGQRVDTSEKIVIDFNGPVINVVLRVGMMGINEGVGPVDETGKWTGYDQNGIVVASGVFGPEDSDLGPDVQSFPDSYGAFPFTLHADVPLYSLAIEATAFDYGRGEPKYVRNYDNESGNTENNSDFNIGAITYTRSGTAPTNSPPVANNDNDGPVREDIGTTRFSYDVFLANDTDADGDTLRITSFDFSNFPGTIEDKRSDRVIEFRTAVNFNGDITIPYTITDGIATATAIITLTISDTADDMDIGADGPFTTNKNEPLTIAASELLANDTSITYLGSPVEIVLVSVGNAINGSAIVQGDNIVFTPAYNFAGQASFTYSVLVMNNSGFGGPTPVNEGTSAPILITVEGDSTPPISINQNAVLVSKANENLTLQVNAKKNRTSAIVEACDGQGQVWTISDRGNGFHKISNDFASKAIEAWQSNPSNGDDVTIFSSNDKDWQQWEIIDVGSGYLKIKGKYNQRFMTFSDGNAVMLDENGQDNQLWKLLDPATNCDDLNNPPVAGDDGATSGDPDYTLILGETLVIPFTQLLANDFDLDGDPLIITAVQPQRKGNVVIVGDTVEFTGTSAGPAALFTYTLSDGRGGTDTGFVLLNILAPADGHLRTKPSSTFLYPTFVKDIIYVFTEAKNKEQTLTLTIYNYSGGFVKKMTANEIQQNTFDISDLQPGGYIVHLVTNKRRSIHKIMKH